MICKLIQLRANIQSDEEYRELLIKRNKGYGLLSLCGIFTIIIEILTSSQIENDFTKGFIMGVGWGLLMIGGILYLRNKRILSDEKRIHEKRLALRDERNQMIEQQAMGITFYGMFALCYCAMIVSLFFRQVFMITITLIIICISMCILFVISKKVLSRRY